MANQKNINTRIIHKHDIEANWLLATNFIPKQGEIIVYDIDANYNYERFKIGDGITSVSNLPFVDDNINIFNSKSGTEITITNASSVEHNLDINLQNINLFYQKGTITPGSTGLTLAYDPETNIFTINGTQTTPGNLTLSTGIEIPYDTYTVTLYPVSGSIEYVSGGNSLLSIFAQGTSTTFVDPRVRINSTNYNQVVSTTGTPNKPEEWNNKGLIYWQTYGVGNVYNNYQFKVQIEKGQKTTTGYVPHADLSSITLTVSDNITGENYTHQPTENGLFNNVSNMGCSNITLTTDAEGVIINCKYLNNKYTELENNHIKDTAEKTTKLILNNTIVQAGDGLSGGGDLSSNKVISHADTSDVIDLIADNGFYVTGLTFDDFGHVTGVTTDEGEKIYKQNDEPTDVEDGTLWIDLDQDEANNNGGLSMKVLWENASVGAINDGTKILIDNLDNYDLIGIYARFSVDAVATNIFWGTVNQRVEGLFSSTHQKIAVRFFDISNDGITCNPGYYESSVNKSYVIPLQIYGIKGVK